MTTVASTEWSPEAQAAAAAREARRVVAAAHGTGLLDTHALAVAAALGLQVPRYIVEPTDTVYAGAVHELLGDVVVVKALVPNLGHKADVGGVQLVERDPGRVGAAIRAMRDRLPSGMEPAGFLVAEFVDHDPGPTGELLLGVRWSDDFGPVVVLAPGGAYADLLGGAVYVTVADDPHAALAASRIGRLVTEPFRGRPPPVTGAVLADLVARFTQFAAMAMPEDVAVFEINPLVLTAAGPMALDAHLRPGPAASAPTAPPRPLAKIQHLLRPGSIAIVGVSSGENPGRIALRNVLRAGYPPGRITVVKPGAAAVEGCRCVPDLAALESPVDLLVVALAADQVPALIEEVAAGRRAESVIVIAGGMGERPGTADRHDQLTGTLRRARATPWAGPVVNGGNCLGVRSVPGRYDTLFVPAHKLGTPAGESAPVAILAQSGAFVLSRLDRLPWLRPRYVVTVGNQSDLTIGDYLTHLAVDPDTSVFACYVEGFRPGDGSRFLTAARAIRDRGGTVVLYPAGRTPVGAVAAASHTAAVAGDPAVTVGLAERAGVLVAAGLAEFEDLLMLSTLLRGRRLDGLRLGSVSNAGFDCVAIADYASPFRMASLSRRTTERLAGILAEAGAGNAVAVTQPLDLTPMTADEHFAAAAETVLRDPGVDVAVIGCVPFTGALQTLAPDTGHSEDAAAPGAVAALLGDLWARSDKAWVTVVDGGRRYDAMAGLLLAAGIPTFRRTDRAVRALGQYAAMRTTTAMGRPGGAAPGSHPPA